MKIPVVDLSSCIQCGICQDLCPQVFRMKDAGYVEIAELADYPELEVNDCINVARQIASTGKKCKKGLALQRSKFKRLS